MTKKEKADGRNGVKENDVMKLKMKKEGKESMLIDDNDV